MNDPEIVSSERLVAALRSREPDALPALFDAYADRLFRYCWFMLRNRDITHIALRDTLIVAVAHIERLADPKALSSWLYALARVECRRRRPVPAAEADEPPARPSQLDADSRLMAWHAVTSMGAAEIEALDLACRHDVELGLVLGMSALDARALLDRARQDLDRALGAEILVSRGSHACPDRIEVMRGWAGTVTPELRERVLQHASGCPVCGPNLPRNVSAARVFALLPVISLPSDTRQRVLAFAGDPQTSAYREFAVSRAAELGESGFPLATAPGSVASGRAFHGRTQSAKGGAPAAARGGAARPNAGRHGAGMGRAGMPRARVLAAVGATAAAAAVASVIVLGSPSGTRTPSRGIVPTSSGVGSSAPRRAGAGVIGALPVSGGQPTQAPTALPPVPRATANTGVTLFTTLTKALAGTPQQGPQPLPLPPVPLSPRVPGGPVSAPPSTSVPTSAGTLTVTPATLDVGSSSQGQVVLTAVGGQQTWSAGTSSGALSISGYGGTLQAGQSVPLVVTVNRTGSGGGAAIVYIDQGTPAAQTIKVFWSGPGPRPTPSPSPTPTPTPTPSRPSPSPSASSGSSPPGPSASDPPPSPRPTPRPRRTPPSGYTPPPRYTPPPSYTPPPRPTPPPPTPSRSPAPPPRPSPSASSPPAPSPSPAPSVSAAPSSSAPATTRQPGRR